MIIVIILCKNTVNAKARYIRNAALTQPYYPDKKASRVQMNRAIVFPD